MTSPHSSVRAAIGGAYVTSLAISASFAPIYATRLRLRLQCARQSQRSAYMPLGTQNPGSTSRRRRISTTPELHGDWRKPSRVQGADDSWASAPASNTTQARVVSQKNRECCHVVSTLQANLLPTSSSNSSRRNTRWKPFGLGSSI